MIFTIIIYILLRTGIGAFLENLDGRIMGGNETDIANYPYALQFEYMEKLECGGVLVSEKFALTAGHCVYASTMEHFVIRAGTTNLGEGGQTFTISEIIYHPKFNMTEDNYDVAIVLLSDTVAIATAKPIELAGDENSITEGATILIMGWGWMRLNTNDDFSKVLRVTDLTILGDEECKNSYSTPAITEAMFCAKYAGTKIRDFCYGDYGGPAVVDGVLQGIISFGDSCGTNTGVFVKIPVVKEWIQSIIEA